ncbi:very long-chain specific acyl-CoA dehydrogenase, mitochondrial [Platysternon megacephalum]|uniref:Very long-chain specific acyl-CoA dehydrogenase, mitochondrial n=1 Tax=Platysternon megacephalum TaxID=55544 RepID=A0A4D9DJT7_9SAUR|nr:very long-chain specific acyl-CoA dehydrogenase, mitochondrial [Platysternon megacephalum]
MLATKTVQSAADVVAWFRGDVTLSCFFPSQPGMNLQDVTLTWQKEQAGAEALVVHSHYYGREQLDEGIYLCHVTSELGWTSELRELRLGGEPHLTLDPTFRLAHTLWTFSSGGRYPRASVAWKDGMGTNLTELSNTTESVDTQSLYTLHSELAVPVGRSTNLTVLLVTAPGRETPVQHITVAAGPGQRCSNVWLLVVYLGAVTLSVIVAARILHPTGHGTCGRCSERHFVGTRDVEDPSPRASRALAPAQPWVHPPLASGLISRRLPRVHAKAL